MKLQAQRCALTFAGTLGALYVLCASAVVVAPDFSLRLLATITHMTNLSFIEISAASFLLGFFQVVLSGYLLALLFVWIYNITE